ncbi:protease complex subunit PrcB family protein [Sinomicrobium sp. M5D2P9]
MKKNVLLIGVIILFCACMGAKQDGKAQSGDTGEKSLDYKILLEDSYGGTDTAENRVITSQEELEKVYGIINRTRRPGIEVPKVDFTKSMVVAMFMGQRSSGGNRVEIEKIEEAGGAVQVYVRNIQPAEGDMTSMAITNPFIFAELPRSDKQVVFN